MAKVNKRNCSIAGANLAMKGLKKATKEKAGSTLGSCSAKAKRTNKTKTKK